MSDDCFWVCIHTHSSSDVVIVLAEHAGKLEELEELMTNYYDSSPCHTIISIKLGGYYIVPYQGEWTRVKLLFVKESDYESDYESPYSFPGVRKIALPKRNPSGCVHMGEAPDT